ncbi:cell wall metabolism sensor histidine kinase WalK [Paenibacillus sp. CF384]|uniref:sensor histidine kinase n=1 Tax=Paenibacillus sp. CF384 TaxID=1884382 RepID=UPI00089A12C1|nr:HAMP domain-containing sensor histidine kinase [Paenibacillus sp. CF384]SDX55516.1 Signal transduction histidine kinase [Paenibacillus sp. CF384]
MKFWQKTYLSVLIVFLIAFDLGAYALLKKSYELNEQLDISRGMSEYGSIEKSLSYILRAYTESSGSTDYETLIASFAANPNKENILLEVYRADQLLFSNAYEFAGERAELHGEPYRFVYRKMNGELWLFVGGKMELQDLRLVISRKSEYLQDYHVTLRQYFIRLSIVISLILSAALIFLLFQLTAPIRRLNKGVKAIAAGAYEQRVKVSGNDEFGELAQDFNKMAGAVSHHIETINKASEDKELFINNLTHELKTPITAIKGYSAFLNHANYNEDERQMAVQYIHEHIARLDVLSGKMMQLLYLKSGEIAREPVDIENLFAYVVNMERHHVEAKQMKVRWECSADKVYGDQELLQSLFINLVENSIKASSAGGEILLRSFHNDEGVVLEVLDHGRGIPQKDIARITEAFYVVDRSRSKELGGIGLGLSICHQIAQLHGATIRIESKENEYTRVSVYFTTRLQLED